jgi:hypothetical protein
MFNLLSLTETKFIIVGHIKYACKCALNLLFECIFEIKKKRRSKIGVYARIFILYNNEASI